jgi:hypothetical protein
MMTTNSNDKDDKDKDTVTIGEHVSETHRRKPIVGQVVTGDIVGGEVTKNEGDGTTV